MYKEKVSIADIPRTRVWVTVVLGILTNGLYVPWWFWERMKYLNALKSDTKLNPATIAMMLVIAVTSTLTTISVELQWEFLEQVHWLKEMDAGLIMAFSFLSLFQALKVRKILSDHFLVPGSFVLTFLFSIFYLQYLINRFPFDEDVRDSRQIFE